MILAQTYQLSFYGDELVEKSTLVGMMAYGSEWYLCNEQERKILKFLMLRAQKPCIISIYRFAIASRQVFRQVNYKIYLEMMLDFKHIFSDHHKCLSTYGTIKQYL